MIDRVQCIQRKAPEFKRLAGCSKKYKNVIENSFVGGYRYILS